MGIPYYFAELQGDKVTLVPDGAILRGDEIDMYDDSLVLPMGASGRQRAAASPRPRELIINDLNFQRFVEATPGSGAVIDGKRVRMGLVPRDYRNYPVGYLATAKPFDLPLIPDADVMALIAERTAAGALLSNFRNRGNKGQPIPSRDQDGVGYCWCHSGTSAMLVARAVANEPYADLSAFAVGCMIKGYRDEGGWGSEGVEFIGQRGVPTSEFWAQRSMSRANDNPRTWENAKLHRFTDWMDGEPRNEGQLRTGLISNASGILDFNWWSHSVGGVDYLGPRRIRIWNSWGDSWSENGLGILEGSKAIPDGMLFAQAMTPSMK
jgi:hypothetical protein